MSSNAFRGEDAMADGVSVFRLFPDVYDCLSAFR
jgi:hypothetical protein